MNFLSILVSLPRILLDQGMFDTVVEEEDVWGDGLNNVGERVEMDGRFSPRISVQVLYFGSLLVRLKNLEKVTVISFLGIDGGMVVIG